jgi:enoyl-CoA hydratase
MDTAAPVNVTLTDGVATIRLCEPERRNALHPALVDGITGALDDLEGDPGCQAVVVTGTDGAFCAGADLSHLAAGANDDQREAALRSIYEAFLRVAASPLFSVAAVNGPAVGAGLNLALACDVILAGHNARFDSRFLSLGIGPGGGHTWWLQRRVGPQGAAAMVLGGDVLDATDAERVGLAWRAVPDGELDTAAMDLARRAASAPPELVRRTKDTLARTRSGSHADAVATELATQLWSMGQPVFAARLGALSTAISSRSNTPGEPGTPQGK